MRTSLLHRIHQTTAALDAERERLVLQSRTADLERQLAELRQRNEKLDVSLEEALRELHQQQAGGGGDAPSRGSTNSCTLRVVPSGVVCECVSYHHSHVIA